MILTGALSVFLLQSALNAGSLVAAQLGFTGAGQPQLGPSPPAGTARPTR